MHRVELFKDVQKLLAQILKINTSEVKEESSLEGDLGLDSVDFWDAIASFRKKFNIKILESEVANLKTVKDIVDLLVEKSSGK